MEPWWRLALDESGGVMGYAAFVKMALYAPGQGYYRRNRARVGRGGDTDFTTATAVGPEFGALLVAAVEARLRERGEDPGAYTWLEVGAEPGRAVLDGVAHPFGAVAVRRLGEAGAWPGRLVVFANEVLDAQPFRRLRFRAGAWRELGVAVDPEAPERLCEVELAALSEEAAGLLGALPASAQDGYTVDWPSGAEAWLRECVAAPWAGLLVLADYGKEWADLVENFPEGTARAYVAHRQEADLLASPGERDLTCHVAWDRLEAILREGGFGGVETRRQEAFLMPTAGPVLAAVSAARAGEPAQARLARVQALKAVLHPAYFGTRFQVMAGFRPAPPSPA